MSKLPRGLSIVEVTGLKIAKLYSTNIVLINDATNEILLNSDGWNTKHTKKCMNLVINRYGFNVYQKDFTWYVQDSNGNVQEFHNGIKLKLTA